MKCSAGLALISAAVLLSSAIAAADEFPDVAHLPSVKELPDPLVMLDGRRVTTRERWLAERKPELKRLFQHYMYGNLPAPPKIRATVERVDHDALGGKATMKQVTIAFGPPECPAIHLLLITPNSAKHAPAIFLGMNFTGNHSVLDDPRIAITPAWMRDGPGVKNNRATDAGRGIAASVWQIEHVVDHGYAVATFYYGEIAPDNPAGSNEGVFPYFRPASQTMPDPTDWACIGAYAWSAQRAVDYLLTDGSVDGQRIIIMGHSRMGKTALAAAAFDDRIAAVIAHQAGCGGSAPSRRKNPKAESLAKANKVFPQWFDGVFKTFSGQEDRLPFDQNCLVALCAPRPVLFGAGTLDQWSDPSGQLEVLKGANSVYRLFGLDGIAADAVAENDKVIGGSLCYFIRESKHTVDRAYWDAFIEFADRVLPAPK